MIHSFAIRDLDAPDYCKPLLFKLQIDDEINTCYVEYKDAKGKLRQTRLEMVYGQIWDAIDQYNLERKFLYNNRTPGPTANRSKHRSG